MDVVDAAAELLDELDLAAREDLLLAGLARADVEAELARTIGATTCIWLPRGLTRDYDEFGTRGHVDIVACFSDESTVLVHDQRNPEHPDFAVSAEVRALLGRGGPRRSEGGVLWHLA